MDAPVSRRPEGQVAGACPAGSGRRKGQCSYTDSKRHLEPNCDWELSKTPVFPKGQYLKMGEGIPGEDFNWSARGLRDYLLLDVLKGMGFEAEAHLFFKNCIAFNPAVGVCQVFWEKGALPGDEAHSLPRGGHRWSERYEQTIFLNIVAYIRCIASRLWLMLNHKI